MNSNIDGIDYDTLACGSSIFNTPSYPQYSTTQTETTEVTEEEFDGDGKLVSRKVTKTTRTYPKYDPNQWTYTVQY